MKIIVDKNNVVTSIIYFGDIEGSIEINDVPDDFDVLKYKYIDNRLIKNPDYPYDDIELVKTNKIKESKTLLADWLQNNPILYTDGKYYNVTEEKQALLNGNLASYERAASVGIEYDLKWNSTGAECEPWNYNDLVSLSLTIAGYVAPKVAMQQAYELQIKACESVDEINEIVISYD